MDGLKTARVLVIDDAPNQVVPLITALGLAGIGAVYLDGDLERTPERPLEGIRVLFLDMELEEDAGEDKAVISRLMAYLPLAIADRSHPLGIVTWTRRGSELIHEFQVAFSSRFNQLRPVMLATLDKTDDVPDILDSLPAKLAEFGAFNFLLFWEQLVSDSAADTTRALSDLVDQAKVQEDFMALLATLGKAGAGPDLAGPADALSATLDALNVVLEDRVARRSLELGAAATDLSELTQKIASEIAQGGGSTSSDRKAELNRLLLVAPVWGTHAPRPGNVYLPEGFGKRAFPISEAKSAAISLDVLIEHMCKMPQKEKERNGRMAELRASCIPALVEVTPDCDYALDRMDRVRLIAGLLVPVDKATRLNGKDYVKSLRPVYLRAGDNSNVEGIYVLALDALMIHGVPREELESAQESWRLRKQQFVDVQVWFSNHAARPGVIQID
jgi:hypothetical protein